MVSGEFLDIKIDGATLQFLRGKYRMVDRVEHEEITLPGQEGMYRILKMPANFYGRMEMLYGKPIRQEKELITIYADNNGRKIIVNEFEDCLTIDGNSDEISQIEKMIRARTKLNFEQLKVKALIN